MICKQINRVLPGFDRFAIEVDYGRVMLRWKSKWSDKTFGAHITSDGSLRFFALATLLNLPPQMLPDVILLDEPELGLHPSAIYLLGGMIKSLSVQKQVIVATQSPLLVDSFDLDQIFVLDLIEGETKVSRPDEESLKHWLEEYSTGELWQKNVLGGRSVIRLAISVEGETEEQFVNLVLIPHLVPMGILPTPILLGRARNTSSGGGNVSIERLGMDMAECYHNYDFVTSLVDFYGFRRRESRTVEELEQQILQEVGRKLLRDLDARKVIPYIQKHEFEGLLFST